jgi:FkbM family methyltransferase
MPSLRVLGHAFRAWRRNLRWRKHEPETPYLADLLSGAPVCLHVGASDGRHSYVMTQVAPKATIYAIEPSAFSFAVLKLTLAWHGIGDRVTPVHAAVGDKAGEMLLITPRKITGRMGRAYAFVADEAPVGEVRPDLQDTGMELQKTPVTTLDAFCEDRGIGRVDFIRMDIEGAEFLALQGAKSLLERDRPHLLIEIHPIILEQRFSTKVSVIETFFRSLGYVFAKVENGAVTVTDNLTPPGRFGDFFLLNPARDVPEGPFRTISQRAA